MLMVFRWLDSKLYAHEVFTGLYVLPTIQSATIVSAIEDAPFVLIWFHVRHVVSARMTRVTWLESGMVLQNKPGKRTMSYI